MLLSELIENIDGAEIIGDSSVKIVGLDYDSRRIRPQYLFAAIKGFKVDGLRFIPEALERGAAAVMSEEELSLEIPLVKVSNIREALSAAAAKFYDYPGQKLFNIGVTGTNGKSTCVNLIRNILRHDQKTSGMVGSLVYDTGGKRYRAERTTPDSVEMQRYLAEMLENGCTHSVLEVSSHALLLNRVDNIEFSMGLFTTFSRDHLDFHQNMDDYLVAKKKLLERLDSADKAAVVNLEVPEFAAFRGEASCRFLTYATEDSNADVYAEGIEFNSLYTDFVLRYKGESERIRFALPGRYNLSNGLGAAAVGLALGVSFETVCRAMENAEPLPGRFQPLDCGQPFGVLIDFAHTPDALERLCQSARELTEGRLLVLFGCGGDRDRGKRPLMSKAVAHNSDFAILSSDNPRTEAPDQILDDAAPGLEGVPHEIIMDRKEAIVSIMQKAGPGDTVILAGKGAEEYQEIGTERMPFSDIDEACIALNGLGYEKEAKV